MRDGSLSAFNVTYSDSIHPRELDSLREFTEECGSTVHSCILLTKDTMRTEGGIYCISLWRRMPGRYEKKEKNII